MVLSSHHQAGHTLAHNVGQQGLHQTGEGRPEVAHNGHDGRILVAGAATAVAASAMSCCRDRRGGETTDHNLDLVKDQEKPMLEGEQADLALSLRASSRLRLIIGRDPEAGQLGQDKVQLAAKLPLVVAGDEGEYAALQALHQREEAAPSTFGKPPAINIYFYSDAFANFVCKLVRPSMDKPSFVHMNG